jgi:uncharacterized protein YidB (DUF937 family)
MAVLNDIAAKLGGSQGQDGGLASLQKVFTSNGGLQGLTSKLTSHGMGDQVQSWVGNGQNQPVNGAQVQPTMDPQHLQQMSDQSGMTPEETSDHVAKALPEMVNKATPEGEIPSSDPFTRGLDAVKNALKI